MSVSILLVDDDHDFIRIAQALLEREGFAVRSASNAIDALRLANETRPGFDVVLSDVVLNPVRSSHSSAPSDSRSLRPTLMTGYDLVLHLRQMSRYAEAPIAMLTGRRTREDVERALQVGARDYILKPIDPDTFIQKVKELAQRAEKLRASEKYFEVPLRSPARTQIWTVITSLGLQGGTLESDSPLARGERLEVDSETLTEIGIKKLFAEVVDCRHDAKRDAYIVRFQLLNLNGRDALILKRFVLRSANHERGER